MTSSLKSHLFSTRATEAPDKTEAVTSNVCAGGAYFVTTSPFSIETELEVDLFWPPKHGVNINYRPGLIKLSGKVVRTDSKGIAVSFSSKNRLPELSLNRTHKIRS
jgi:hypothetical protein